MKKSNLTRSLLAACSIVALSAVMYGCVHSGDSSPAPVDDQPVPDAEATALKAAQDAAKTAYLAARDALAGLTGMQPYNPVAYAKAQNALGDARAAHDAAMAAATSEDAKRHQASAEAANTAAMGFVQEVKDVPAARMAAAAAVTAAKAAYDAAMAALAEVEANKADDMDSYDMAKAQVDAAKEAYDAAKAASAAANSATTSADAKMHQATAEAEKAKAETARDEAVKYAGMVSDSFDTAEQLRTDLETARMAASSAAEAAMTARDEAQTAFDGLETKKADDVPNHTRAKDALDAAKAAYDAAKAASDAAEAAMATAEGVAEAQKQQQIAIDKRGEAEAAKAEVVKYAGLVDASFQAAERVRQDAADEETKLATAKTKAMEAAAAARTAAGAARTAANEAADALGATSMLAIEAGKVADAAEEAADAAEAASERAQADTESADAEGEQETAEGKKREAEMKLAEATSLKRDALLAKENSDRALIVTYREQAMDAKTMAESHATQAESKATKAEAEAVKARTAAGRAMTARTDHTKASAEADKATAAATAARAAATAARTAANMAAAEYEKATAAGVTADAAKMARDEARKQRDMAMAHHMDDDDETMDANAQYMAAKAAAAEAEKYAGMYADNLFKTASGQGMTDAEKKARVEDVATEIRKTGNEERDGYGSTGATKAFTLNSNGQGGRDDSVDGRWQIESNDNDQLAPNAWGALVQHPLGKDRVYRFGNYTTEHLNSSADDVTKLDLPMLGRFTGVELSKDTLSAHIYTDYDPSKRKAATPAGNISGAQASSGTVSGTFDLSTAGTITGVTTAGEGQGKFTHNSVTYTATATDALTLTCAAPADCSVTSTGAPATATITSLGSGWRVAGTAAAVPEAGDPDYMTFGYWLDLSRPKAVALTDLSQRVGVFASGNNFPSTGPDQTALTGTATYRGSAAGMHAKTGAEEAVQPFDARAELTADFGTAAEIGGVKGRIYEIVSGGTMLTGEMSEITLAYGEMDSATSRSATEHNARMGRPTVNPTDASATYPINGYWHARLSITTAESDDAAKRYPTSALGTFGVSGTDDMGTADVTTDDVTHSLIGAFGAHLEQ